MGVKIERDTVLDLINEIEEFVKVHDIMDDPELDEALADVLKCIKKPDVPAGSIPFLITKLSAISASFGIKQSFYKTFGKSGQDERYRKDIYYTARDSIDKLVDSLKYIQRAYESGLLKDKI